MTGALLEEDWEQLGLTVLSSDADKMLQELETLGTEFHATTDVEFARRSSDLDTESRRLFALEGELLQAILATPATTSAGLAIKARILVRELEIESDIDVGPGDLQSVGRAAADARQSHVGLAGRRHAPR